MKPIRSDKRGVSSLLRSIKLQESADRVINPRQTRRNGEATKADDSGTLYLVHHEVFDAAKVGVTRSGVSTDRLRSHADNGWSVVQLWHFELFSDASTCEAATISWWRNELALPPACTSDQMPQGGFTETVSLTQLGVEEILLFLENKADRAMNKLLGPVPVQDLMVGVVMTVRGTVRAVAKDSKFRDGLDHPKYGWIRWVVRDSKGDDLLLEGVRQKSPLFHDLRLGSEVEVTGRVEKIGNVYRMTNPIFTLDVRKTLPWVSRKTVTSEDRLREVKWTKRKVNVVSCSVENYRYHGRCSRVTVNLISDTSGRRRVTFICRDSGLLARNLPIGETIELSGVLSPNRRYMTRVKWSRPAE